MEKQRSWSHKGRYAFRRDRIFTTKRTFKRRRRNALFALGALALLVLVTFLASSLYTELLSARGDTAVQRVETPSGTNAPEPVADLQAQAEQEAAEQAAAEQENTPEQKVDKQEAAAPAPPEDPTLYLTVPRLGIYDHTVRNDDSQWALDTGAVKIPSTGFPWQGGANTYIAGHRIGWPNTETYYQFYNLPTMQAGDDVYLTDANGTVYTYKVSDIFAVSPSEVWVTEPTAGRDMVSLQTCTETPDDWWTIGPKLFESGPDSGRLVVQADKVAVDYA